jgi:hypothetical protein
LIGPRALLAGGRPPGVSGGQGPGVMARRGWSRGATKGRMQAVGACMRKLVMVCYGVLKNRTPYDPAWASTKAP